MRISRAFCSISKSISSILSKLQAERASLSENERFDEMVSQLSEFGFSLSKKPNPSVSARFERRMGAILATVEVTPTDPILNLKSKVDSADFDTRSFAADRVGFFGTSSLDSSLPKFYAIEIKGLKNQMTLRFQRSAEQRIDELQFLGDGETPGYVVDLNFERKAKLKKAVEGVAEHFVPNAAHELFLSAAIEFDKVMYRRWLDRSVEDFKDLSKIS